MASRDSSVPDVNNQGFSERDTVVPYIDPNAPPLLPEEPEGDPTDGEFQVRMSEIPGVQLLDQPLEIAEGVRFLGTGPRPEELQLLLPDNLNAADTTNTNQLWPNGTLNLDLSGAGLNIGVWDTAQVRSTHTELTGRVTSGDGATEIGNHATHVAGTIGATGLNQSAHGMANEVNIRSYDNNNDIREMRSDANLLVASNHSYSNYAGWDTRLQWDNITSDIDTWYVDQSKFRIEDPQFGKYNDYTRAIDQVLFDRPNLLSVWAASNNRNDAFSNAHGDNTYVTVSSSPLKGTPLQTGPGQFTYIYQFEADNPTYPAPPPDGNSGTGYDSLPPSAVAKNNLVVGAIDDITVDPYDSNNTVMADFSGWGPTDDGRLKLDLVANGVDLLSSGASSDTNYYETSGTSMATPNVTGTAALLIEHYNKLFNAMPRSATTKGLLIHTATDAGNTGPDYTFGWGVLDAAAAASFLTDADEGNPSVLLEEARYRGTEQTINVTSDGTEPLKVTIGWTDPPGPFQADGVDRRTRSLVNDLDLWVTGPGGIQRPWTLNPGNPEADAVRSRANRVDNIEQVLINQPVAGGEYTIHVRHAGRSFNQDYSLFTSGLAESINGTAGNNTLRGTSGDDIILGLSGNDLLRGVEGDDILNGGDGNDTLIGGAGDDTLRGGRGADRFVYDANDAPFDRDIIQDFQRGADRIRLESFGIASINDLDISTIGGDTVIDLSNTFARPRGADTITLTGITGLNDSNFEFVG